MYQLGPLSIQQFGFTSLEQAMASLISAAYVIIAVAALFYIMWGGMRYIVSGGDDKKTEGARKTIVNAMVGLIVLALTGVFWETLVTILLPGIAPYYGF